MYNQLVTRSFYLFGLIVDPCGIPPGMSGPAVEIGNNAVAPTAFGAAALGAARRFDPWYWPACSLTGEFAREEPAGIRLDGVPRPNQPDRRVLQVLELLHRPPATVMREKLHNAYLAGKTAAPGLAATVVVALAATYLADHYHTPPVIFALLLGMALNTLSAEPRYAVGIGVSARVLLRISVALLG